MAHSTTTIATRGHFGTVTDRIVAIGTRGHFDTLVAITFQRILSYALPCKYSSEELGDRYRAVVMQDKYEVGDSS